MIFSLLITLVIPTTFANSSANLVKSINRCFSASQLATQINETVTGKEKLKGADLQLKLVAGYSNNEISNNNPERAQLGASLRWNDLSDQMMQGSFIDSQVRVMKNDSKLMLEEYWRTKILDFYFWKWGRSAKDLVAKIKSSTGKSLAIGQSSMEAVGASKKFQDLILLHQTSIEFLTKFQLIDQELNQCIPMRSWGDQLDFSESEIKKFSQSSSNRISYQASKCSAEKDLKTIQNLRDHGTWGIALATSFNRNKRISGEREEFNDVRMGLELSIPLSLGKASAVIVDRCDYEKKSLTQEDDQERNESTEMYPLLKIMRERFVMLNKRLKLASVSEQEISQELLEISLIYFQTLKGLIDLEAKISGRIVSSQIVEYEL